jgi:hypothetical protein
MQRLQHMASAVVVRGGSSSSDDLLPGPDDGTEWLDYAEEKFRAQSYLIIPGALSPVEVLSINAAIDSNRAQHPDDWDRTRAGEPGCSPLPVGGAPHRFQSVAILERTEAFDPLLCHPRAWPLIQRLMGGDACFDEASIMVREACPNEARAPSMTGGGPVHEQHWHRDGGAVNHALDHPLLLRNLSLVWLLDDCDDAGHAFSLVPESVERKRALMRGVDDIKSLRTGDFHDDGSWPEPPPPVDPLTGMRRDPIWDDLLRSTAVDCVGPAGSLVIMNTGCAHAGSARQTSRPRRTVHLCKNSRTIMPTIFRCLLTFAGLNCTHLRRRLWPRVQSTALVSLATPPSALAECGPRWIAASLLAPGTKKDSTRWGQHSNGLRAERHQLPQDERQHWECPALCPVTLLG